MQSRIIKIFIFQNNQKWNFIGGNLLDFYVAKNYNWFMNLTKNLVSVCLVLEIEKAKAGEKL